MQLRISNGYINPFQKETDLLILTEDFHEKALSKAWTTWRPTHRHESVCPDVYLPSALSLSPVGLVHGRVQRVTVLQSRTRSCALEERSTKFSVAVTGTRRGQCVSRAMHQRRRHLNRLYGRLRSYFPRCVSVCVGVCYGGFTCAEDRAILERNPSPHTGGCTDGRGMGSALIFLPVPSGSLESDKLTG